MGINEDFEPQERRIAARRHINMGALLKGTDGREFEGTIRNISETGCLFRAERAQRLEPGRHYSLRLEGLEMQVVCAAWSEDGHAGLELAEPLHPAVVDDLVRAALLALAANARADRAREREPIEDLPPLSRGRRGTLR
ncbi:MAG: PilZ domain-containing protein [Erythrobacter sp.]